MPVAKEYKMSLFKKKSNSNDKIYQIPYSNHFKGFKKFLVNVYKNPEAEKNNLLFINIDLSDSIFEFWCFDSEYGRTAKVLIDGKEVGRIYDAGQLESIEKGKIEKIHAHKKDNDDRLGFYVKYKE